MGFPSKPKTFPICWIATLPKVPLYLPNQRPHIAKKGITNCFYTSFTKYFTCDVDFQLHNHRLLEHYPLIQNSVRQNYRAELYPIIS